MELPKPGRILRLLNEWKIELAAGANLAAVLAYLYVAQTHPIVPATRNARPEPARPARSAAGAERADHLPNGPAPAPARIMATARPINEEWQAAPDQASSGASSQVSDLPGERTASIGDNTDTSRIRDQLLEYETFARRERDFLMRGLGLTADQYRLVLYRRRIVDDQLEHAPQLAAAYGMPVENVRRSILAEQVLWMQQFLGAENYEQLQMIAEE